MRIVKKRPRRTVLGVGAWLVAAALSFYVLRLNWRTLFLQKAESILDLKAKEQPSSRASPLSNNERGDSYAGSSDRSADDRLERRDVLTDRVNTHSGSQDQNSAIPPAASLNIPVKTLFVTREWADDKLKGITLEQENRFNRFYTLLSVPRIPERVLSNDAVIIDIGANIGKFSDRARLVCPECTIICFEAVPLYAARIKRRQASEKTQVIARGLSNRAGSADIFMDLNNIGWNTLVKRKADKSMSRITIDLLRLDDIDFTPIVDFSKVRLIKIDTEGSEGHILNGAHGFLSKLHPKPILFLEIAWGAQENPNWSLIRSELEWLFANGWKRVNYEGLTKTQDLKIYPSD